MVSHVFAARCPFMDSFAGGHLLAGIWQVLHAFPAAAHDKMAAYTKHQLVLEVIYPSFAYPFLRRKGAQRAILENV